jgi:hypothetical protein
LLGIHPTVHRPLLPSTSKSESVEGSSSLLLCFEKFVFLPPIVYNLLWLCSGNCAFQCSAICHDSVFPWLALKFYIIVSTCSVGHLKVNSNWRYRDYFHVCLTLPLDHLRGPTHRWTSTTNDFPWRLYSSRFSLHEVTPLFTAIVFLLHH